MKQLRNPYVFSRITHTEDPIMLTILNEALQANREYSNDFDKGDLPVPPGRQFATLTCMDAIRSLVISYKLLSTKEWFVIHRTDNGMETFSNEIISDLLGSSLKTASVDAEGWHDCCEDHGSAEGKYINWLTIKDQTQSVTEDVIRIKSSPLVPADIPVYGYINDVNSRQLIEVTEATTAGEAI